MLEGVIEPAQRVAVFVAVLRDGEVGTVLGLEQHLRCAELKHIEDLARPSARKQQPAQVRNLQCNVKQANAELGPADAA